MRDRWVGPGVALTLNLDCHDGGPKRPHRRDLTGRIRETESGIHAAANRVRYSRNNALIATGAHRPALTEHALAAAAAIGPVEVDPGETGCKTPDAGALYRKAPGLPQEEI